MTFYRTLLLLALTANVSMGQTSKKGRQDVTSIACSNVIALAGNVNLDCSKLTPEQDKLLRDIPAVLQKILARELDPAKVMQKLDELLAQPRVVNSCTGSICGNTLVNPVVNNYRPPAAKLMFEQQELAAPSDDPTVHLQKVSITTDRAIAGAIIWLEVDTAVDLPNEVAARYRPTVSGAGIQTIGWSAWNMPDGKPGPHLVSVRIDNPNPFRPGQVLEVTIPSKQALRVLKAFEQPAEEGKGVVVGAPSR